ncbi:MAG: methyltransferase domain-containing protein [Actinobacteria bacterium]|nr:MAG: methyltransferase domain-containing protein [Actinomycetota bacterium]
MPDLDDWSNSSPLGGEMTAETVVHARTSAFHHISVIDIGYRRILQFERTRQSSMYLDNPFETDFEYPGFFHVALAIRPDASRTLMIGLGGGTTAKRMWRDYPEMRIDAVELDPDVVAIAREYFELPDDPRIRVVVDDGRHFVETTSERYDIVIVDAFHDDRIPPPLTTEEFFRALRSHMTEDGVVAFNVIGSLLGDRSRLFRSLHRTLRNTFRRVWVFNADEGVDAKGNNLVVIASDTALTTQELRERIAARVAGRVSIPGFDRFGENLYEGPIRSGDVPILSDPHHPK